MDQYEKIITDTYSGLTMYYRDSNIDEAVIQKYQIDQLIMEPSYIAVSSTAGGLTRSLRFAVASNKAVDQSQSTPGAARWGAFTIRPNAHFKVLDIYTIDGQTQVFLLHVPEEHLEAFYGIRTNIEEQIIAKARKSFEEKVDADINMVLEEDHWKGMTEFPLGVNDQNEFFPIRQLDLAYRDRLLSENGG